MSLAYEQNKKHIYKYYATHPEKIKQIRVSQNRKAYTWRKIKMEFLGILF